MKVSFFSGKVFLVIGAIFLATIIVLALLPNDAETDPESSSDGLRTRVYRARPEEVLKTAEEVIRSLPGWNVVGVSREDFEITAECTARVLHFVDEVHLTVEEGGNEKESEVDVSSVSRLGIFDFGRNARNIEEVLTNLDRKLQRVR